MNAFEVQKAIYTALTGNSTLMSGITGVFDSVPQDTSGTYVVIGDDTITDWDDDRSAGFDIDADIHVWSPVHRGRATVKLTLSQIYAILHRQLLTVPGADVAETYVTFQDSFLDADGVTYHGVLKVRILLNPSA